MSQAELSYDLEIDQDLDYQRRAWTTQRIGWGVMALVVLAALLGLFGSGLFSSTTVGQQNGPLSVEYPRFARLQAPTELRAHIGADATDTNKIRLWLDRAFVEDIQIQQIVPEPDHAEAGSDRLWFVFMTSDPDQPTAITFFFEPQRIGIASGRAGLDDEQVLDWASFVYP